MFSASTLPRPHFQGAPISADVLHHTSSNQHTLPISSREGISSFANPMATRTSPTLVSVSPLPLFKVDVDPLDGIAPSTVAMIILFGSLTFATVGMAAKAWMTGDKRGEFVQM